jgi:hypothetical protein
MYCTLYLWWAAGTSIGFCVRQQVESLSACQRLERLTLPILEHAPNLKPADRSPSPRRRGPNPNATYSPPSPAAFRPWDICIIRRPCGLLPILSLKRDRIPMFDPPRVPAGDAANTLDIPA